jgi:GNAT superfamily N-acetyltransferase
MTVRGASMRPFIRGDDVVELAPIATLRRGDVVLAQTDPARHVVHRIVHLRGDGVWLRGDAHTHGEGPIACDRILGVVTHRQRGDRVRTLNRGAGRLAGLMWLWCAPLGVWLLELNGFARRTTLRLLRRLQCSTLYRAVGRRLRPGVAIRPATPDELSRVAAWLEPHSDCGPPTAVPPAPADFITYIAWRRDQPVGIVRRAYHATPDVPETRHWLYSLIVKTRYRGMGIGEALARHAISQACKENADEVYLRVFENNQSAIALYTKLGFKRVSRPAIEHAYHADVQSFGCGRIVMCKHLS